MKKILAFLSILSIVFLHVSCNSEGMDANLSSGETGIGGSMARFTVSGNFLYTVDDRTIKLFDITDPTQPKFTSSINAGFGIETIYPYKDNLFLGTQTGMIIYDIKVKSAPVHLSTYSHVFSCDPVVVNDKYAFVTLRSGTTCRRGANVLEIIDIQNLNSPKLLKSYPMTKPMGLGIAGTSLFVCDEGLKVMDVTDVMNVKQISLHNIKAFDVIPRNGLLMVIGDDGLYQYSYTNTSIQLLSKISAVF